MMQSKSLEMNMVDNYTIYCNLGKYENGNKLSLTEFNKYLIQQNE